MRVYHTNTTAWDESVQGTVPVGSSTEWDDVGYVPVQQNGMKVYEYTYL